MCPGPLERQGMKGAWKPHAGSVKFKPMCGSESSWVDLVSDVRLGLNCGFCHERLKAVIICLKKAFYCFLFSPNSSETVDHMDDNGLISGLFHSSVCQLPHKHYTVWLPCFVTISLRLTSGSVRPPSLLLSKALRFFSSYKWHNLYVNVYNFPLWFSLKL